MPNLQRSITALYAVLPDNTAGAISPQDIRDIIETLRNGHGEMAVTVTAETTINNTEDHEDLAGTYALSAFAHNWDMNTNGQMRYIGPAHRICHFAVSVSLTSASNNQDLHLRVAKNGVSIAASDIDTRIGTGADVSAFALHAFTDVVTNDFFTLEVRNSTSTGNVTAETLNFFVMDMAIV